MTEMQNLADELIAEKRKTKYHHIHKLESKFSGKQYICPKCERETQRHLEFCANCGKKQLWL